MANPYIDAAGVPSLRLDRRLRSAVFWLSLLLLASAGCSLSDLRSPEIKDDTSSGDQARTRGRQQLDRLSERYGGLDHWRSLRTMEVELTDRWPSLFWRLMASPWPQDPQAFRLMTPLGADDGRLQFVGGDWSGRTWGLQQWVPYEASADGGGVEFTDSDDIRFWIPTIKYFTEFPFRICEADVVLYAGERTRDDRVHDLVFATWNQAAPQEGVDQYVLWIDRESGLLELLQYTVRDVMGSFIGTMDYADFKTESGIVVPHRMTVVDSPQRADVMHEFTITDVRFGAEYPPGFFYPDPRRRGSKH